MSIKQKKEMRFGDFISAAYRIWGAGEAEKKVRLAINARLVVFRGHPHFVVSSAKGRFA